MIRVRGLTQRFGTFTAVDGLSFDVEEGEIFGFIGPNGAGKTTTIRVLATLLLPTSGTAHIYGRDVTEEPERVREVMGFMPDSWGVYPDITVREYLEFFAASYAVERRRRASTIEGVMELTDLSDLSWKLVEELSKGMKQRLCLAKTLIHDPRLLLLDEPASGLDPRARIVLRELLRELASMGKTILISSHILTELSDLVTSVGIVERGRMLMSGDVQAILNRIASAPREGDVEKDGDDAAGGLRKFVLRTPADQSDQAKELLLAHPALRGVVVRSEQELVFGYEGEEARVAEIVRALVAAEVDVLGLAEQRADLESAFMAITRGDVQ